MTLKALTYKNGYDLEQPHTTQPSTRPNASTRGRGTGEGGGGMGTTWSSHTPRSLALDLMLALEGGGTGGTGTTWSSHTPHSLALDLMLN